MVSVGVMLAVQVACVVIGAALIVAGVGLTFGAEVGMIVAGIIVAAVGLLLDDGSDGES